MSFKSYKLNLQANESSKKHLIARYRILYKLVAAEATQKDGILFKKSIRFITNAYQDALGPLGSPYVYDLLEMAIIMAAKFRLGIHAIVSTLLQTTLKDHKISPTKIKEAFSDQIGDIVSILTNLTEGNHQVSAEQQALIFKPVLSKFSENNLIIVLIKLAEYLHSLRMLDHLPEHSQEKIMKQIRHIYIPLAHRLGISYVQIELENLYLQSRHREIYENIAHQIKHSKATKPGFLERFIAPIHAALQQEIGRYTIKARTKSIASIWHKIETRHFDFEDMHDLYAIRIIFDSDQAQEHIICWLIYEIITNLYEPRLDRLKDWITYPKESGYEALHITVMAPEGQWVEIQIRSNRMDKKAEYGHAAHWKYKDHYLAQELAHIDPDWFDQARSFLMAKWDNYQKPLDIQVDNIYIKPTL